MHHSIVATFFVVAIAAASGQLDGQLDSQSALGGVIVTNAAFGGSAGTGNASIPAVTQITRALGSAAAVEAGTSTAPKPVQRAFLLSLTNGSDVGQKSGFGGFPWSTDVGRKNPNELQPSSESIVESDGSIPTCEVTVQTISLFNSSADNSTSTLINLAFHNWSNDTVVAPWTTVVNGPYTMLSNALNVMVDVAQGGIIQGSVVSSSVAANGTSSVPITLIVEAPIGTVNLVPTSVFQNGKKCTLITVGPAANAAITNSAGTEAYEQPISIDGINIIGTDGNIVNLKGVNWFGFDDGITMLEGLWLRPASALEKDLAVITQRILLLGFNAVRLPFSMQDLFNKSPKNPISPCLFPSSNQEILDSVTKPGRRRTLLQASTEGRSPTCSNVKPPSTGRYSCEQQQKYGKCNEGFMQGYCNRSCNRCSSSSKTSRKALAQAQSCSDNRPPGQFSCQQQKNYGKCNQSFMRNYCNKTCGRCGSSPSSPPNGSGCSDTTPPGGFSCQQQKNYGKCNQSFMRNYCNKTCGRCGSSPAPPQSNSGCSDTNPPGGFSCQQQKNYGKCNQSFMRNYCNKTCGRCGASPPNNPPKQQQPPPSSSKPGGGTSNQRSADYAGGIPINLKFQPAGTPGICNSYVPGDSVFNRFLFTLQFLTRNGIYVMLDNQFNFDTTAITNPSAWLQGWKRIATAVNSDPPSRNRVIYDALNEPDAFNVKWEPVGNTPGMANLLFSVFDAIYKINPQSVFLIEGLGQQNFGNLNWGDGLITDPQVIQQKGLSDPNPFFRELLRKPYRKQTIIGVHVYPPSISNAKSQYTASNGLIQRLSLSHGYLNKKGYCNGNDCQVFPLIYGEIGSFFGPKDTAWLESMVAYINNVGVGADGQHNAINSWFWWSWNANSGDTGGVLGPNWKDIVFQKMDYMERIGLKPWYAR